MSAQTRRRVDPLLGIVLVAGAGIVVAALHHPQAGMWVICVALAVATALRAALSERDAGLLVVRRKGIDVVLLASLAVALGVMAAVTP